MHMDNSINKEVHVAACLLQIAIVHCLLCDACCLLHAAIVYCLLRDMMLDVCSNGISLALRDYDAQAFVRTGMWITPAFIRGF